MVFNNYENLLFFPKSNFYKSKFANTYMSYEKLTIVVHIKHWSYSKWKDMLETLNVDQIPLKEHQVVDRWDADEISVW